MGDDDKLVTDFEPMRYRLSIRREGTTLGETSVSVDMDPFMLPLTWHDVPEPVTGFGLYDADHKLVFWKALYAPARVGDTVTIHP